MIDLVPILISALLGWLGWHVTLSPPSGTKRKRRYYVAFILLAIAGVVLSGIQAIRNGHVLSSIEKNTSEPASFYLTSPDQDFPIAAGRQCIFNVNFKNGGPVLTIGTGKAATQCFISPYRTTERDQQELLQEFEDYWLSSKQMWHLAPIAPNGVGMISTNLGPTF